MSMMMSSETRWPASMIAFTRRPSSVPEAVAARSMSPVASWMRPCFCSRRFAWVPLPAPGGPNRIRFIGPGSPAPAAQPRFLDQPLILVCQQVRMDLRHRVHRDADHDQEAGAAEIEWHRVLRDQQLRENADCG